MKRSIVVFIAVISLAATVPASGQSESNRGGLPGAIIEALGLSESQVAELQALRETQREQRQAALATFRSNTVEARGALETSICAIRDEREVALQAILTPEQRQDLALIEAIREASRPERRRERVSC